VDFVAGKLLDLVGVKHGLETRWDPHHVRPPVTMAPPVRPPTTPGGSSV